MSGAIRIYIKPSLKPDGSPKASLRGPLFDVFFEGELVVRSHQPFFDGARALSARGLTGAMEMWDYERPCPRMHSTVEKAAKLTVVEGRNTDIRIDKWKTPDHRLRGLSEERRKGAAESLDTSNSETTSDGVTAEVES